MNQTHQLQPGAQVRLAETPTRADPYHSDRESAEAEFKLLRRELRDWQRRLYAENRHKILILLQAMDAGGKDGTIRRVFQGVNPQGVQVTSFKVPSKKELAHDFLWRVHNAVPGQGMIGIFNRSHYEDVLVVRVNNYVPESVWRPRYELINDFERLLVATGTTLLKFYLHISSDEQKARFQARLDDPEKHWKFSREDLEKRNQWDAYMAAYEEVLSRCSTESAPWYVIPADQKWYRNLAIARVIAATFQHLNPQYPPGESGLGEVIIS